MFVLSFNVAPYIQSKKTCFFFNLISDRFFNSTRKSGFTLTENTPSPRKYLLDNLIPVTIYTGQISLTYPRVKLSQQ